jgi:uncharacterized delta-60 repeat protein
LPPACRITVPLIAVLVLVALPAGAAPGEFDPSFDGDGMVESNFGVDAAATAVAIQSDGKIVAVGEYSGTTLAVARFEIDGSPDLSFGTGGLATADFGMDDGAATAVVLAPDGKIVVAGVVAGMAGVPPSPSAQSKFGIARFDSTGTLDPSFGTGGMTVTDIVAGTNDYPSTLVRLSSGRLVVGGSFLSAGWHGALVGYDDAGQLDSGFGDSGVVVVDDPEAISGLAATGDTLLAAGWANYRLALARFQLDGTPSGVTHVPEAIPIFTDGAAGAAIAVDPDGGAVVVGSTGYCADTIVARFAPSGALEPGFGNAGVVALDVDPSAGCGDGATAVAFQPDGKILFAAFGVTYEPPPLAFNYYQWWLVRLDPDGALDPSFGDGGSKSLREGFPAAIALQADGKVVTAGFYQRLDFSHFPPVSSDSLLVVLRNEAAPAIACDAAPRSGCGMPLGSGKSLLKLTRATEKPPTLQWKWQGSATSMPFGDPITGGSYAWCVYDATEVLVAVAQVEGGGTCGAKPCWKTSGSSGWQYGNKRGTVWGIEKMKLKAGAGGTQIQLQGKHANLPSVPLPAALPLRVQMLAPTGSCFEAVYSTATKNDTARLTARSD